MAKEIERKYLVISQTYRETYIDKFDIKQGYINLSRKCTVRVRVKGNQAFITVKGLTDGCERDEWEYPIPMTDAAEMLERVAVGGLISKTRYVVEHGGLKWEIDEFHDQLEGLVVAELELPSADFKIPVFPDFIGKDVTGDERYYNSSLATNLTTFST